MVDDNAYAIEQICDYINLNDIKVDIHKAYNGQAAIYEVDNSKFDLILLDISMPDISGIEVLKHIRSIDKNVKVVIASVWALEYQTEELIKLGIDDFLVKPIYMDKVIEWIKKIER